MGVIKIALSGLIFAALASAAAAAIGRIQWRNTTERLLQRIDQRRVRGQSILSREAEIADLPPVVQTYFRAVLPERFSVIRAVSMTHEGDFNMGETSDKWIRFSSNQRVVTGAPGFVWNARMRMMPLIPVYVHDAYVLGEGILKPSILGLSTLADMRGGGAIAEGELMRFLAEAPWYPTALLPEQGVKWTAIDDHSARATLADGPNVVSLIFQFGPDSLIDFVRAEARGRTIGGKIVPTPWEGRWTNYAIRDGINVPMSGEVAWLLPEGRKRYWRGTVASIAFDFDRLAARNW